VDTERGTEIPQFPSPALGGSAGLEISSHSFIFQLQLSFGCPLCFFGLILASSLTPPEFFLLARTGICGRFPPGAFARVLAPRAQKRAASTWPTSLSSAQMFYVC
jgi:hypothetical protein